MLSQAWIVFATVFAILCTRAQSLPKSDKILKLPGQPEVKFEQYSGYITIDQKQQRALFYYFVQAENDPAASKPLVLWLNGGPGCSSIGAGAFVEHGPFKPSGNVLLKNEYSWNKEANMLYLESPAGVGFSYSANKSFYDYVGDEITGHYVPQLADLIIQSKAKINLKGIAIGNPLLEFNTDFNSRSEFLWSHGLISDSTHYLFTSVCNNSQVRREYQRGALSPVCTRVISQVSSEIGKFIDSYDITLDVCLSTVLSQSQVLNKMEDGEKIDVCVENETGKYLNRKDVQKALHARLVGVTTWDICSDGDQDSVLPLTGTRTLVHRLAKEMGLNTTVPYTAWFEGRQVGGWTQVYGDLLSFATIRGASHEAPFSQPERSLVLFASFVTGHLTSGHFLSLSHNHFEPSPTMHTRSCQFKQDGSSSGSTLEVGLSVPPM
ncbi:hypothetical protein LguiA_014319 [Lonicera macranthoides]